jgi:hypothetical protein
VIHIELKPPGWLPVSWLTQFLSRHVEIISQKKGQLVIIF